jgi:heme/copper-type cytochrome/quinol oxidase subunit 1
VRTVGLLSIGFGLALLILPTAFVVWAHHRFTVGVSGGVVIFALAAVPGLVVVGLGGLLVWAGARRAN